MGLSACVSTSPDMHPELGAQVNLQNTDSFSEASLQTELKTVAIINGNRTDFREETEDFISTATGILRGRGVKIEDNALAESAKDQILRASFEGKGNYTGGESAEYALITVIDSLGYSSEYSPSETKRDKDGDSYKVDASCDYRFSFNGRIEVRGIPSLELKKQVAFEESDSRSIDNPSDRKCPVTRGMLTGASKEMFSDALTNGDGAEELMGVLSPKFYVTSAFQLSGKTYYKTNIGIAGGVKESRSVKLYAEKSDGALLYFGEGEFIAEKFADDASSFISVDSDIQAMMKKGTVVKVGTDACETLDLECHSRALGL